jgi:tetratricopeptide (TPR) repeat protein
VAYSSEIEKLEKRWAENPRGRNFAPLADAYRKAGELDRAIELCKAGLEHHPDYVSAHIVYGRCLLDRGDEAGATAAFQRVLGLDPENVLALKMLAEIAERGGHLEDAVRWWGQLLAADPMNGEAAEALARAKTKLQAIEAESPAAGGSGSGPGVGAGAGAGAGAELVVEHVSEPVSEPPAAAAAGGGEIETFDGTIDFDVAAHAAAKAEGLEVQEEVELEPQVQRIEGLAATPYESAEFVPAPPAPPAPPAEPEDELPAVDLPLIMPDDGVVSAAVREPPSGARSESEAPAAVRLSDDDGAADTAALSRAEPVLTETMAELYLRQGHREDALRVYEALLARRPGDARLRALVETLAAGAVPALEPRSESPVRGPAPAAWGPGTGESVAAFLKRVLAGRPRAAAPAAAAPPEPEPGSALDGAFAGAPAEPEPGGGDAGPAGPAGAATHPASDSLSLDAVFGEEGGREGAAGPAGPGGPEPGRRAEPGLAATGGFSFDEFFSGASGAAAPEGERAGKRPSGPAARPPAADEADLDQFQAWLRGLKS